jgi:hypothetical protein
MQTLDEMRDRKLLTAEQHEQIRDWIRDHRSPEAILDMPPRLWRSLALASMLMNVDADLTLPYVPGT